MLILKEILNWSEVWALLIPLVFLLLKKNQPVYMRPVKIFVLIDLFLKLSINIIWKFKYDLGLAQGDLLFSNNFIYNLESLVRFLCFGYFFLLLKQPLLQSVKKILPLLFLAFFIVNFIFFENFFNQDSFSSRILALETGLLLLYCMLYYFVVLSDERHEDRRPASFWVVTGLSIFVVINFPIVLFYKAFIKQFEDFAIQIWDVSNISFIIFCILLAKAFNTNGNN